MKRSAWLQHLAALLPLLMMVPNIMAVLPEVGQRNNGHITTSSQGLDVFCAPNCRCLHKEVICEATEPNAVLPHVFQNATSLTLLNYDISDIKTGYFEKLDNIRWLKLHDGQLKRIPKFPQLIYLTHLDLSNNLITTLGNGGYLSGGAMITHLNVSGNHLMQVEATTLDGLSLLRVLDLSRNPYLTNIDSEAFSNLPSLEFLDLSRTSLTEVSDQWLLNLPHIHYLNISNSDLSYIPKISSVSLQILDISYNAINKFPDLTNLQQLDKLYISNTNVTEITGYDMHENLRFMDIQNTHLTTLTEGSLSGFKVMENLLLSHNLQLERIEHRALDGLMKLQKLMLNDCPELTDIDDDIFTGLSGLQIIDLSSTKIQVLPRSLSTLANLTNLYLNKTTLKCDCHAHWLPYWLSKTANSQWEGVNAVQCMDGIVRNEQQLHKHHNDLGCTSLKMLTPSNQWVHTVSGQSALLDCNVTGKPPPIIIWQSSTRKLYVYRDNNTNSQKVWPWLGHKLRNIISKAVTSDNEAQVMRSGHLSVNRVTPENTGRYKCVAINAMSNVSAEVLLGLDGAAFHSLFLESILFGFACSTLVFLITLIVQFIRFLLERLGCEYCCCCKDRLSPKAKQIRKLLESVESYKSQQLERLRENYNYQVVGIKDGCYQQMERLRESYTQQTKNLRELRDYSTYGLTSVRDQYLDQTNKVRDYSTGQMNRVRENYVFQRNKIRKFSAQQLIKLRETYKYQQKTLNKLLENLPDMYLQNCRTGGCQRTDSLIFDNEIHGLDSYYRLDFLDIQSYGSEYYTPNSTLTRSGRNHEHKHHSRNSSNTSTSTDFQEAQSWITRKDSLGGTYGIQSPMQPHTHTRSSSVTTTPQFGSSKSHTKHGHKRSLSACHSKVRPSPSTSYPGMPEETSSRSPLETPMYSCVHSLASSPPQTPSHFHTPPHISPVKMPHDSPVFSQTAPTTPSQIRKYSDSQIVPVHHTTLGEEEEGTRRASITILPTYRPTSCTKKTCSKVNFPKTAYSSVPHSSKDYLDEITIETSPSDINIEIDDIKDSSVNESSDTTITSVIEKDKRSETDETPL